MHTTEARMTQMFPKYFGVHQQIIRRGVWAEMSPSARAVYVVLMHECERRRSREITVRDVELAYKSGIERRSVIRARQELVMNRRLFQCRAGSDGVTYTLCDPETGLPYPGNPKDAPQWRRKEQAAPQEPRAVAPSKLPHKASMCPDCRELTVSHFDDGSKRCDKCGKPVMMGVPMAEIFRRN